MTGFISVGDLSRTTLLRQANVQLKARLQVLTEEAATGLKADVPAAARGQMGRLAQIEGRLAVLGAHCQAAAAAQAELGGLQSSLEALNQIGVESGIALQAAATTGGSVDLRVRAAEAEGDFHSAVRLLNVSVGGRHLLSGTAVDRPPLSGAEEILADLRAEVSGLTTASAIATALDAWFSAPPGAGGFADAHFHGNAETREVAVAPSEVLRDGRTALDPAFGALLKGLALGALAADPGLPVGEGAALLGQAGQRLSSATTALTTLRADVGLQEEAVERAMTRNAAEATALSLARSDMLAADPYETAAAITQTETSLQNLYALTARLSRLSLTDYL